MLGALILIIILLLIFSGAAYLVLAEQSNSAQSNSAQSNTTPSVQSNAAQSNVAPASQPVEVKPTVAPSSVPAVKDSTTTATPQPSPVVQTTTTAAVPAKDTTPPATAALAVKPVVTVSPPPPVVLAPAKVGEKCNPGCATGAWCNTTDNMCYETCVAKDSCTNGNAIQRKGTYYCDYSNCSVTKGALSAGCKKCPQAEGYFWCPAGVVGGPTLVSSYRLPQYDPIEPQYTIGGEKYYFRESGDDCK